MLSDLLVPCARRPPAFARAQSSPKAALPPSLPLIAPSTKPTASSSVPMACLNSVLAYYVCMRCHLPAEKPPGGPGLPWPCRSPVAPPKCGPRPGPAACPREARRRGHAVLGFLLLDISNPPSRPSTAAAHLRLAARTYRFGPAAPPRAAGWPKPRPSRILILILVRSRPTAQPL